MGWRDWVGRVGRWLEFRVGVYWGKTQGKSTGIPSPMARSLTSAGLSNIESGGPQAAKNNFVG